MRKVRIALFFLAGLTVALLAWVPVAIVTEFAGSEVRLEAERGVLIDGSLVVSTDEIQALPIAWQLCTLRFTQPLGICIELQKGVSKVLFGLVPWKLGEEITLYNVEIDSPLADLLDIGVPINALALLEGSVHTDFARIVVHQQQQVLYAISGTARFENVAALGLRFGDIDLQVTQQEAGETVSLAFEGGDINELVLLGTGTFEPVEKTLSIRTVMRSNKASVLKQLDAHAKKIGKNSYEWVFTTTL